MCFFSTDPTPTLTDLITELQTVSTWYTLGLQFLVEKNKLDEIRLSFPTEGVERWRIEMIDRYYKSGRASWKGVVSALREIGEHGLANHLEGKYIKPSKLNLSCYTSVILSYTDRGSRIMVTVIVAVSSYMEARYIKPDEPNEIKLELL